MALRSVSYFRERDQGHDHVHHGNRDRGRGVVGPGHVGVNGIINPTSRNVFSKLFNVGRGGEGRNHHPP